MSCAGCPCHVYGIDEPVEVPLCLAEGKCIEEEDVEDPQSRTRMAFPMTAKGFVQMDVTVEYPTTEKTAEEARKAIDAYREICTEKGLKIVAPVEINIS